MFRNLFKKKGSMNEAFFWKLMESLDWDKTGDDSAVIKPVVDQLAKLSEDDIFKFSEILSQKLYALDTLKHAQNIGEDAYVKGKHFSSDWFLYVRCCVVANGKDFYQDCLSTPEEMPKDIEFEALLSIDDLAYKKKTGQEYTYITEYSYETFSNKQGWES
ncbi:MAG TPA: DUF4240 domain-containing protein [Oligoflexia bacterium]|nr:DUF4240 domain-containing protein [Oligoflexia bacterium]HMR25138.1 DUF4240 domain-containing protein [Oligoflexia bacterium]